MNTLRARNASDARAGGLRTALLCGAAFGVVAMPSAAFAQDAETAADVAEERVIIVLLLRPRRPLRMLRPRARLRVLPLRTPYR